MTRPVVLTAAVYILAAWASVNAAPLVTEQTGPAAPAAPHPGVRRQFSTRDQKDPYRNLFRVPDRMNLPSPTAGPAAKDPSTQSPPPGEPRVVCGMTIIPVDPTLDAGMHLTQPDTGTEYTMRVLKPPICSPE